MDPQQGPMEIVKDWGGWVLGAMATWLTLKKGGNEHIDERIRLAINPDALYTTLRRIEEKIDEHGDKLDQVGQRVAHLEGAQGK